MSTINLHLGDSMKALESMQENQYELAIVDPPYGINADKKNSTKIQYKKSATKKGYYGNQEWDSEIPTEKYFNLLKLKTKNQIIWGANYFGLKGGYIVWNKLVDMPTYSDGELAYCSLINSIKIHTFRWHGMLQGNMKNKEIRTHPTQKPVALYKWLLQNYAKEGDKILDTHGGSMSIAIACGELGFDLDLWELDEEYFDTGVKRVQQHFKQMSIGYEVPIINVIK